MPSGPGSSLCGHSGCVDQCAVRYVGPTSHPRDHLLHKAAYGAGQVWTAAIVAGLAVVLTASIAFAATQAETAPKVKNLNEAVAALWRKLDNIERLLKQQQGGQGGMMPNNQQQNGAPGNTQNNTCLKACEERGLACKKEAAQDTSKIQVCGQAMSECVRACLPAPTANGGTTSTRPKPPMPPSAAPTTETVQ